MKLELSNEDVIKLCDFAIANLTENLDSLIEEQRNCTAIWVTVKTVQRDLTIETIKNHLSAVELIRNVARLNKTSSVVLGNTEIGFLHKYLSSI